MTQPARGACPFRGVQLRPPNPHTNHAPKKSLPHVRRGQGRVLPQPGGIQPQTPLPPHLLACSGRRHRLWVCCNHCFCCKRQAACDGEEQRGGARDGEEPENLMRRRRRKRQVRDRGSELSQQGSETALQRGAGAQQSPHHLRRDTRESFTTPAVLWLWGGVPQFPLQCRLTNHQHPSVGHQSWCREAWGAPLPMSTLGCFPKHARGAPGMAAKPKPSTPPSTASCHTTTYACGCPSRLRHPQR